MMALNTSSNPKRINSNSDIADWRVLIVDDVLDNIAIAEAVMTHNGAEVRHAKNGIEGLDLIKTFDTNLILLDLSMPDMNGWDMHNELRRNPDTAWIPVIALTAHAMEGDREKVLEAGFDGYIPKPFSVRTLINEIKAILKTMETQGN